MKSKSQCMSDKEVSCVSILRRKNQILEVGHLNNKSKYILERDNFHIIFLRKGLPALAGMKCISKRMPEKDVCCVSIT